MKDYKYMIAIDFEATSVSPDEAHIIEIGASKIRIDTWGEVARFEEFVFLPSELELSKKVSSLTKITRSQLDRAQPISIVWELFLEDMIDDESCFAAFNSHYDIPLMHFSCKRHKLPVPDTIAFDALDLTRILFAERSSHKLANIIKDLKPSSSTISHRAYYDCASMLSVMKTGCQRVGIGLREAMNIMGSVKTKDVTWYKGDSGFKNGDWIWIAK